MDNISWGTFGMAKPVVNEVKQTISIEDFTTSKDELLDKCEILINDIESLYTKVQNKYLSDALVTLHSVKKSLKEISIKNKLINK